MEAVSLLGTYITTEEELATAPQRLFDRYGANVLVKGGHFSGGETITDYLWLHDRTIPFTHPRLDIPDTHGTGCTLSAAITANLAKGQPLEHAVGNAVNYLTECLQQHHRWTGDGIDIAALNHFPDGVDFSRT
jgi:hydroxymethylpyrimidine kinase/phosphomethylpyrimidine kinase